MLATLLLIKMIPAIIPLAIMAGAAVYQGVKSSQANKKAKELEAKNQRPAYKMPGVEWDNLRMLEHNASQGLSDNSKTLFMNNADRGLTAAYDYATKNGGSPNSAASVYQNYLNQINTLSVADDQAKIRNMGMLLEQKRRISQFQDKEFTLNEYAPYQDAMQAAAQLRGEAATAQNNAVNIMASAASTYAGGLGNAKMPALTPGSQQVQVPAATDYKGVDVSQLDPQTLAVFNQLIGNTTQTQIPRV